MPETEEIVKVVSQWIRKAENDLRVSTLALRTEKKCPTDAVSFHAQQCIEKYLKALLAFRKIDFPKTHNLSELIALLPHQILIELIPEEQEKLTDYATVTRYPGDYDEISLIEAKHAVKAARRIRKQMRKLLPKEVLREKRG
jgi:HEPN domain-containing protein